MGLSGKHGDFMSWTITLVGRSGGWAEAQIKFVPGKQVVGVFVDGSVSKTGIYGDTPEEAALKAGMYAEGFAHGVMVGWTARNVSTQIKPPVPIEVS